ncbi:DegT/DnrJ/EryC1/StrS family aminotransferase [Galactobacter caseinivorans]|uniref:DegT/DnrJ/EryC1/StrS family aminotransferase n=1 Tax=Galactobacter caseinivorans TaxID=2676123 RepID=A0A496PN76_9MICC|nr:DegT/DnrJ/EryC1/StrS family aminotransferase [Galactobacter caseinivorans]RKW71916.1 DegT/DnrJ/EryC1/StrS family aminotransferase [Galactobacter caseinivorans]
MAEFIPPAKPMIGEEEIAAVTAVMRSGMVAQGPEVAAFEEEFSPVAGGAECIAVNSGTSALHLGLIAAGIGRGDEVIVPSFTFAATANSVVIAGGTPVFVDIDPVSFCMDPVAAEAAITPRTKAIMPVHLYGHPADVVSLKKIADRHGILLLEDAAQAHGASLAGRAVGSFGAFGAFSFYPTKNMTSGEGGIVSTGDPQLARTVRLLRNQGMEQRYANELAGFNARMTDIHAAIGRVQLTKLEGWTQQRRRNAAALDEGLQGVVVPAVADGAVHVYHQYTVRVPGLDRDRFMQALREEWKVGSGVYYPIPNHRLPSLKQFAPGLDLPQTEAAAAEVFSLPVHPSLSQADIERVIEAVNAVAKAGA